MSVLAKDRGELWYFRENASEEPHSSAVAVIELVVKYQVPISMSTKPDFSDYVDESGVPRPRR